MNLDKVAESAAPDYFGSGTALFWLVLRTTVWNLLTLGLYRFWQRTRMRQHYWNSVRFADSPFEYTGTGLEKFLGFLIAVVFLAVYLGVFQLGFFFVGLQLTNGSELVGLFSSLPVLPLIYYAQYRARRYILSRTQLRGIRFSLSKDAWAYTGRGLQHLVITVLSLGILYPRMHWMLEKFVTGRTRYGTIRLHQGGRWQALMRPWLWVIAAALVPGGAAFGFAMQGQDVPGAVALVALTLLLPLAWINYRVASFRILTNSKSAGSMSFTSHAKFGTVLAIYFLGYLLIAVIGTMLFTVLTAISAIITGESFDILANLDNLEALTEYVTFWVIIVGYLGLFLMGSALHATFIAQPLLSHYVSTLVVHRSEELRLVRQRTQDDFLEAEGFADALDVGGAY